MTAEEALDKARAAKEDEYEIARAILAAYYKGKSDGVDEFAKRLV